MENGRSSVARVSPRAVQSGISTRESQTTVEGMLTMNGSLRRSICANALERMEVRGFKKKLVMEGPRTGNSFANADLLPVMTIVPERRLLMWGNTA